MHNKGEQKMKQSLASTKKWMLIVGKGVGIGIVLFFTLVTLFNAFYVPESYFILYPAIDTEFAPNYTEEKFDQIQVGMTKDEVISMLGEPLLSISVTKHMDGTCFGFRYPETTTEIFSYTGDGACWFADYAWLGRWIYLDQTGKVTAKNKSIHYD